MDGIFDFVGFVNVFGDEFYCVVGVVVCGDIDCVV